MGTNGIFAYCCPAKRKLNKRSLLNGVGVCSFKVDAKNLQISHYSGRSGRLVAQRNISGDRGKPCLQPIER